jgi:hypothetical protein
VEWAKANLATAMAKLETYLHRGGSAYEADWKAYLRWQALEAELASEAPSLTVLEEISPKLRCNVSGLERPEFVQVRTALRVLIAAAKAAAEPAPEQAHAQGWEMLQTRLAALANNPHDDECIEIGRMLGRLEGAGPEAAELVSEIRQQYSHPNLQFMVSQHLLNELGNSEVKNTTNINEVMLGATVTGTAYTRGTLSFDLRPSTDRAIIDIKMVAQTNAPSMVGRQQRVSVYSSSQTACNAFKRLYVDEAGLHSGEVKANCATSNQYRGVEANLRLIERFAWRRLEKIQGEAEAIASRRAEQRVEQQLNQQAAEQLKKANNMYEEKVRTPLTRLDLFPQLLNFGTSDKHLKITVLECNHRQFGAANVPHELNAQHDLAMQAHESMFGNACESYLGGKTIHDTDLLHFVKLLNGEEPRALWVHANAPRWSMTLPIERPIAVRLDQDQMKITWRADRVTRGDEQLNVPLAVTALYQLEVGPNGPHFVRVQDLDFQFAESNESPGKLADFQEFLLRKFNAVLSPELSLNGLVPPSGGTWGKLRHMQNNEFKAREGWLVMGYKSPAPRILASSSGKTLPAARPK